MLIRYITHCGIIVVTTYHHKQKKSHQLSPTAALSMIDQSTNTDKCSNSSNSKRLEVVGAILARKGLNKQRQYHVRNWTTMLNSVHLDCSKANVGTLAGIAEGATVSL